MRPDCCRPRSARKTLAPLAGGLLVLAGACTETVTPREPSEVVAVSAMELLNTVGLQVMPSPSVVVKDMSGKPLPGVPVNFVITSGGGTIVGEAAETDTSGVATVISSRATFNEAPARLTARGVSFYQRDRGFMDSIYLKDANGLTVELACYKFQTPEGFRDADVLILAHRLRGERGDHHIGEEHLTDAIELLMQTRDRLST